MQDFRTVSNDTLNTISELLRLEFINQFSKVRVSPVTGSTNKSIVVKYKVTQNSIEWSVYGGEGYIWATLGKKANTKLPMVKSGGVWDLLEPLKTWHGIVTPDIPKFILARAIARKPRSPIDLTGRADKVIRPAVQVALLNSNIGETILNSLVIF